MVRRLVRGAAAVVASVLAIVVAHAFVWMPYHARAGAEHAARRLGADIEAFRGPDVSGTYLTGTRAYHWQRTLPAGDADGLDVLPFEGLACWWSRRDREVKQHGCDRWPRRD